MILEHRICINYGSEQNINSRFDIKNYFEVFAITKKLPQHITKKINVG